jgi:hypothetical protein
MDVIVAFMRQIVASLMLFSVPLTASILPQKCPNLSLKLPQTGAFAAKKKLPAGWVLQKLSTNLEKTDFRVAEKACANWTWVAAVVALAGARGAHIEQQYLIDRLYGGSICTPLALDPDTLTRQISHDYVLPDGQKFRLGAQFSAGSPTQPDPLIVAVRQNRPLLVVWQNRPYLLTGISYDEHTAPTGNKVLIVTELKLFDPSADAPKHELTFSREDDNADDLNGVIDLNVYPK